MNAESQLRQNIYIQFNWKFRHLTTTTITTQNELFEILSIDKYCRLIHACIKRIDIKGKDMKIY